MGMNEVKMLERFFADLLTMHNQNDVEDAFFAAISNRPGDGTPPAGEVPEQSSAGEVPEQSPRRHWLQLHDMKLVRLHAGDIVKFVGAKKANEYGNGARLFDAEIRRVRQGDATWCEYEVRKNGKVAFSGAGYCGLGQTERVVASMLRGIEARMIHNARHRKVERNG